MPFVGNVITAPVSIADVQQALGDGRNDLGTLCKSNNVKMWAKFRPIECKTGSGQNIYRQLTESDRERYNYGISNIPIWANRTIGNVINYWIRNDVSSVQNLPNGYNTPPVEGWWAMSKPSSVYRLTDFVSASYPSQLGYFPYAEPPIGDIQTISVNHGATSTLVTIIYSMGLSGVSEGLTIKYGDLSAFSNINFATSTKFGVIIQAGNDTYLDTQNFWVGTDDTVGNSLWSYGAVIRFRIDTGSGTLSTYALNSTPFKIFPVLAYINNSSMNDYCYDPSLVSDPTPIRKISGNASGIFVALQEPQEITLDGVFYIEPIILYINAYKHKSGSTRLIYYNYAIKCNDPDNVHYFTVDIILLDSSGSVLNTVTSDKTVSAGATVQVNSSIDGATYYNGAQSIRIDVKRNAQSEQNPYFKDASAHTVILDEKSPYIE